MQEKINRMLVTEAKLGWKREISFQELVERMVKNDLELVKKEAEANN